MGGSGLGILEEFVGNSLGILWEFFGNPLGVLNCILTKNCEYDMKSFHVIFTIKERQDKDNKANP